MAPQKNIRLDLLIALAAHWRSQGEYWCGTPADSRSQGCADDLLKVLGLSKDAHIQAGTDYREMLKAHGVAAGVEPQDRGKSDGAHLEFLDGEADRLSKEGFEEFCSTTDKEEQLAALHQRLGWAFEHGYAEGFGDGANARKMRYKRPSKKNDHVVAAPKRNRGLK